MALFDDACVIAMVTLLLNFQVSLALSSFEWNGVVWNLVFPINMVLYFVIMFYDVSGWFGWLDWVDTAMFSCLFTYHFAYLFCTEVIRPGFAQLFEGIVQQYLNISHIVGDSVLARAIRILVMLLLRPATFALTMVFNHITYSIWVLLDVIIHIFFDGFLVPIFEPISRIGWWSEGPTQLMKLSIILIFRITTFMVASLLLTFPIFYVDSKFVQRFTTRKKASSKAVPEAPDHSQSALNTSGDDVRNEDGYDADHADAYGYQNDGESASSFESQLSDAFTEHPWMAEDQGPQYTSGVHSGHHFVLDA